MPGKKNTSGSDTAGQNAGIGCNVVGSARSLFCLPSKLYNTKQCNVQSVNQFLTTQFTGHRACKKSCFRN